MEYKYDLYISLGSVCSIAHTLKNLKLRTSSGPFDWYVSNLSKIHDAFKNDFKKYFDLDNITIDNSNNGYSKDKDNNMLWFHLPKYKELRDNNEVYINTLNTINRRCERLLNIVGHLIKVFYLSENIKMKQQMIWLKSKI